MSTSETIADLLKRLPEHRREEVLDFASFLLAVSEQDDSASDLNEWSRFSLQSANRNFDPDTEPAYDENDLKEVFD